ncbi:MAG: hypothetical protein Q8P34_00825 [Bacteroidota bacterium]|nr:hypothetical protein [Bacteroidota bacterium]
MATKQQLQLGILNLEYSRFVKDQVLTEVQLNEIIDFFEDQHRITRTCLIGTGIVCGLHLRRNAKSISLSQGVAVTTDGDLLKMSATNFKYFAEYIQPDNGKYDPFYYKQGTEEKSVKLFQLLTDDEKDKITSAEVFSVEELDSKITNWVGLLYLEYYLKNPEKCTPTNCDNLGRRQVARPMVLLISKSDMEKVVHLDTGEVIGDDIYLKYYEAYEKYFTFPVIRPKRIILNNTNTAQSTALAGAYFTTAKNGSSALSTAILELYNAFKFLIDRDNSINISNLVTKLNTNLSTAANALHAQYTYDYYKDVVVAYNELRDQIYSVAFECIPNLYAFPKHIMLGEPNIKYGPLPPKYRHQFYPSPAVSNHKKEVNIAIGMLDRLELMVLNFNPNEVDAIKITPSLDYDKPLEDRAIPFYYQNFILLSQDWNYQKALKANDKLNLSYNANLYPAPVNDETLNPLDYSIDEYNFFRIEGHIGKDYKTALTKLDELKNQKGVPIDIVAVRLGDVKLTDINLDDFACQFEDLNTILHAFQVEINCVLADGSSFFSGFTAKPTKPHTNIIRYIAPEGQPPWIINNTILKAEIKSDVFKTADVTMKAAATGEAKETLIENIGAFAAATPVVDFCDRFTKPIYEINRAVKVKIDDHPDSFGKYYLKAMETDNLTVGEFTEKARTFAAADPELNSLNENERFVVFEYPTQIIGHLNVMQRFVPGTINEITQNFITDYRNFSQSFCKRIKIMRTRLESYFRPANYTSRGFESNYMNMIDRLERLCCGNEKLEVVMREIERRKALILQSLSFSKYAEQHPGLEHKAGSHRGGTFVIVYASAPKGTTTQSAFTNLSADRKLEKERAVSNASAVVESQYKDIDSFALHVVSNDETINREEELGLFFTKNKIERGSAYSEFVIKELNTKITAISKIICREISQPVAGIVIADFCLPYLCCSKCPPVAFIIEKEKPVEQVSLILPAEKACSNVNPLKFGITPTDGKVETIDAAFSATVKVPADGFTYFDPTLIAFTAAQKSVQIGFKVNGQDTTCTILVIKHPEAKIQHTLDQDDTSLQKFLIANFTANSDNSTEDFSYNWKFNDGQTASGKQVKITFDKLALVEKGINEITAELNVANGDCTKNSEPYVVTFIPFAEPILKLPDPIACSERGEITFSEYSPKGALIESKEAPDAVIMKDPPVFDTRKVPAGILPATITFTVGGLPTNCTVVVTKPVVLVLFSEFVEFINRKLVVRYINNTDESIFGKQTYIWNFDKAHPEVTTDNTNDFTLDFDIEVLKKNKIDIITGIVTLKDDPCNSRGVVNTEVPKNGVENNCNAFVTEFISAKNSLINTPEMLIRVQKTRNTLLLPIYNNSLSIFEKALNALNSTDPDQKTALIGSISDLLNQIYSFKVNPRIPDIARILEEILRALLMLMLNLVRCDKTINDKDLSEIRKNLELFHNSTLQLIRSYPQLDLQNSLGNEVVDFKTNFLSQFTLLITSLNTLIQDLSKFPK